MQFSPDFCRGGDFAELGLFFSIFLAGSANQFVEGGPGTSCAHEGPADADSLCALGHQHMERFFLALPSEELPTVEFFACENFKNIKEIFVLGAAHEQLLHLPERSILRLEEGKVFIQTGLNGRFLTDCGGARVEMGQVAGIAKGAPVRHRMIRPARWVAIMGSFLLNSACGKRGGCIGFDDERHILCLVVRIPFRGRPGAWLRLTRNISAWMALDLEINPNGG